MIAIRTWAAAALVTFAAAGAHAEMPPEPLPSPKPLSGPAVPANAKSVIATGVAAPAAPGSANALFQPYASGCCTEKGFSGHWVGRLGAWLCYRPLCRRDACDCGSNDCRPPLFSYFQCSPFQRRYDAVCCESGCGGRICGDRGCRRKGPVTISLTLPRLSIGRCDAAACPPCAEPPCAGGACAPGKDVSFAGPVGARATGDVSYQNGPVAAGAGGSCRPGWFSGVFAGRACGGGGCGLGGLIGSRCGGTGLLAGRCGGTGLFNKQPCPASPPPVKVDLHNLPILAPEEFKNCKSGHAPGAPADFADPGQPTLGKKLMDKARAELKRGELAAAKQIASEAYHGAYGVKAEAAGLLKSIEVLESTPAVRQTQATAPAKKSQK
jgi:hypothetical protein